MAHHGEVVVTQEPVEGCGPSPPFLCLAPLCAKPGLVNLHPSVLLTPPVVRYITNAKLSYSAQELCRVYCRQIGWHVRHFFEYPI